MTALSLCKTFPRDTVWRHKERGRTKCRLRFLESGFRSYNCSVDDLRSPLHRVVIAVKLARDARVELDRLHGRVLRGAGAWQDFEGLVFPDVDRHRERDARCWALAGVARLADA